MSDFNDESIDNFMDVDDSDIIDAEFISEDDIKLSPDNNPNSPIVVSDGVDTFSITMESDPQYDIYPLSQQRPTNLFTKPIYDRQVGETMIAYQKFMVFAGLPAPKRTIRNAWEQWRIDSGKATDLRNPSADFRNIASHWRWAERAFMLDLQRAKIANQIWIERDIDRREEDWKAGDKLRSKAMDSLETIEKEDLGPTAIAKFLSLASELQVGAVPSTSLDSQEVKSILDGLPPERRNRVIEVIMMRVKDSK